MFYQGKGHIFGHFPHPLIYCVKGLENGNASCVWRVQLHPSHKDCISPQEMWAVSVYESHQISMIQYKTNVPASEIYPKLKIRLGEIKILLVSVIFYGGYSFSDGTPGNINPREVFHFSIISPKFRNSSGRWNTDVSISRLL